MWNKIVNPKTRKKVNLNSKIGKSILRNYMKQMGGTAAGEEGNPYANMDLIGANLEGRNLTRANLEGRYLTRVNLKGANLIFADLKGAHLIGANLSGANLSGANLTGANLTGANLTGATLTGANLENASLIGANFTGADLEMYMLDVVAEPTSFERARSIGAYLQPVNADLIDVEIEQWWMGVNLKNADLRGAHFNHANLRGANFDNANLTGANLEYADLERSKLTLATLLGVNLENVVAPDLFLDNITGFRTVEEEMDAMDLIPLLT
jgi:uncharacterized protein YjbI with pentapeptide repeats